MNYDKVNLKMKEKGISIYKLANLIPVFRNYHYISLELMFKFTIKNTDFFSIFDFFYLFFML